MEGQFAFKYLNKKETSCEIDFDHKKSNVVHDKNDNSTFDNVIDYIFDDEKLDYSTIDGKLGEYYQKTGDCYLMASIRDSEVDLSKLITAKGQGNKPPYEVHFPGFKPEFATQTVTAEDLETTKWAEGDVEVRIIEIALNKANGKMFANKIAEFTSKKDYDKDELKDMLRDEFTLIRTGQPFTDRTSFIDGGNSGQTKGILTGKLHGDYSLKDGNKNEIEQLIKDGKITSISLNAPFDSIHLDGSLFFKDKMISGHAYSIKDVKTDENGKTTFTIFSNWEPSGVFGFYPALENKENVTIEDLLKHKDKIILY